MPVSKHSNTVDGDSYGTPDPAWCNLSLELEDLLVPSRMTSVVLSLCVPAANKPMPVSKDGNAEMVILPVPLTLLSAISSLRVSIPADLRPSDAKRATLLTLKVQRR